MLRQTVQFILHAGTRMIVDSCVTVPAASSMWTVQRRRSCEDRSVLCVSLELQGRQGSWGGQRAPSSPAKWESGQRWKLPQRGRKRIFRHEKARKCIGLAGMNFVSFTAHLHSQNHKRSCLLSAYPNKNKYVNN